MAEATTYDAVLLIDLEPEPGFPPAYCETYKNSGIADTKLFQAGRLKLTPIMRKTPIQLPIYEERHRYYCIAKVDTLCSTEDKRRAVAAINQYLQLAKKAGKALSDTVSNIVELFPARVLKGFDFENNNEPKTRLGSSNRFKKAVSATETEVEQSQEVTTPATIKKPAKKKTPPKRDSLELYVPVNDHPLPPPQPSNNQYDGNAQQSQPLHGQHKVPVDVDLHNVPVSVHLLQLA